MVLSDFDGTITDLDTGRFLLDKYTKRDRSRYVLQYQSGALTLEEYLQKQYSLLTIPKHVMLKELDSITSIRPHFKELVLFCKMQDIPFIVVSAGLDFIIHHFLDQTGCRDLVDIYAAKTTIENYHIKLTFPKRLNDTSTDFKEDLVIQYKKRGYKTI